jgi:hypothetical protein
VKLWQGRVVPTIPDAVLLLLLLVLLLGRAGRLRWHIRGGGGVGGGVEGARQGARVGGGVGSDVERDG